MANLRMPRKILALMMGLFCSLHAVAQSTNAPAAIDLSQYKGQVVLLDFWASWCGPCKKSFPWMNALHKKYSAQGLKVLAVNLDKEQKLAQDFLKSHPVDFAIAYDAAGTSAEKFGVPTVPTSFLFSRSGEQRHKHYGFHNENAAEYEKEIVALLAEKK